MLSLGETKSTFTSAGNRLVSGHPISSQYSKQCCRKHTKKPASLDQENLAMTLRALCLFVFLTLFLETSSKLTIPAVPGPTGSVSLLRSTGGIRKVVLETKRMASMKSENVSPPLSSLYFCNDNLSDSIMQIQHFSAPTLQSLMVFYVGLICVTCCPLHRLTMHLPGSCVWHEAWKREQALDRCIPFMGKQKSSEFSDSDSACFACFWCLASNLLCHVLRMRPIMSSKPLSSPRVSGCLSTLWCYPKKWRSAATRISPCLEKKMLLKLANQALVTPGRMVLTSLTVLWSKHDLVWSSHHSSGEMLIPPSWNGFRRVQQRPKNGLMTIPQYGYIVHLLIMTHIVTPWKPTYTNM